VLAELVRLVVVEARVAAVTVTGTAAELEAASVVLPP
jgi:hypothetical protein